ncbi:hypothetical protein [Fimbriiglobus ruber]|uniref:Uncharacterized protein n=1 Tax=Fimbriiglobus ruber TaxID=1908690 RepID=A0A225D099_9BACT|nr:hypothetical protein [Fimbriiglobus ruber]OWK34363.1 hypothetical protein FRUB_10334 [Fimbriiglobus ruber]
MTPPAARLILLSLRALIDAGQVDAAEEMEGAWLEGRQDAIEAGIRECGESRAVLHETLGVV